MAQYTVDLSKIRNYSRRKRASKAMSILREQVSKREEGDLSISPEINHHLWDRGASNPPTTIRVEVVEQDDGKRVQLAESETQQTEQTTSTKESTEESSETDGKYEEALDGTVSDAKDAIKDMENPDYERLLELEQEGKDRKTLKEFLESRV